MGRKYYDWGQVFSRQTGSNAEIAIVVGAKNIGKTFGLRLFCVREYLKTGGKRRFCEICRTNAEKKLVKAGYFDKLQAEGFFTDYAFDVHGDTGRIAKLTGKLDKDGKPEHEPWEVLCYFVALSNFQTEKKRTYQSVHRFIFDEGLIDNKDRFHHYLTDEFLVLANILDSVSRQQPYGERYYVYILGNAVDLTCPYFAHFGINKPPAYGFHFYNRKHVLLHYVEPWDSEEMKAGTLVGRMLAGDAEADIIYNNEFADRGVGEIAKKPSRARYLYTLKYNRDTFAIWADRREGLYYINTQEPKDASNVYTITKEDSTLDYGRLEKASPFLKLVNRAFYVNALRYDSPATREKFLTILDFVGIR